MIVRLTEAYQDEIRQFTAHNQTRLSWKYLLREMHESLLEIKPPMLWTMGILFLDTNFEQAKLQSIACLYIRNPAKDNEIAPCFLYFPNDSAQISVKKQGMKEKIARVKDELGW